MDKTTQTDDTMFKRTPDDVKNDRKLKARIYQKRRYHEDAQFRENKKKARTMCKLRQSISNL